MRTPKIPLTRPYRCLNSQVSYSIQISPRPTLLAAKLHEHSEKEIGLGLDVESVGVRTRVNEIMDKEEKKSDSKRRSKPVEAGFNSDDDEPIGSLLKLKAKRNPKKVKLEMERGVAKGKRVDIGAEKLVVEDEDMAGMDDTLASFRKKLKGPKKDSGSELTVERLMLMNAAGSSRHSLNGSAEDASLDTKSTFKAVVRGQLSRDERPACIVDKGGLADTAKRRSRKSRVASARKKIACDSENGDILDGQRFVDDSLQGDKEVILNSGEDSHCLDVNLEDSLSALFRRAQSGLIKKLCSTLRLKQGRETQLPMNGLNSSSDSISDNFLPMHVRSSKPPSNLVVKTLDSDDVISRQVLSSTPVTTLHEELASTILKDPLLQRSQSFSKPFSDKTTLVEDVEANCCTSRIREEPTPDPLCPKHTLDKKFLTSEMRDPCLLPNEEPILGIQDVKEDLASHLVGRTNDLVSNSTSALKLVDSICHLDNVVATVELTGDSDSLPKCVSTSHTSTVQKICPPNAKEVQGCSLDSVSLNDSYELSGHDTNRRISVKILVPSASPSKKMCASNEKASVALQGVDEFDFDQHSIDSQQIQPCSPSSTFGVPTREVMASNADQSQAPGGCNEERGPSLVSSKKEDTSVSDSRLSQMSPCGIRRNEFALQTDHQENTLKSGHSYQELLLNESVALIKKCSSNYHQNQSSFGMLMGENIPKGENHSGDKEADSASCISVVPYQFGNHAEDMASVLNTECKENKLSSSQRTVRKPKKRRHGDMAYEGDADWETLIHEQEFLPSHQCGDADQFLRAREKLNFQSTLTEGENGGASAVSSGLKAHAAGPVEKIVFKETLKRKGGLQEYLECRNHILDLWNKDISRILPLSDCGVSDTPLVDEPLHASLVRSVYAFLDHRGYINIGVASQKKKAETGAIHNFKLLKAKRFGENNAVADSEDGVSFIVGRVKSSVTSMEENNDVMSDDGNLTTRPDTDKRPVDVHALELSTLIKTEGCAGNVLQENGCLDVKSLNGIVSLDPITPSEMDPRPYHEVEDGGRLPVINPDFPKPASDVLPTSIDDSCHHERYDLKAGKNIIIVGAGPAGLTAARHLQRQGFHVTVLEARNRIGGRVFTDRSSLSVPVDLGASIITGVEADVATERRPDPSSLVCAQLGLELTVLNSDCPLYDIVSSQKVPAYLDEALEAEYNSLLDDMLLLVAQKGEHAMKMSLEDGLEYALKRRRLARPGRMHVQNDLHNSSVILTDSEDFDIDGKVSYDSSSRAETLTPFERRVMDWHFANLEYGCAALLKEVSLPYWNQDDIYGGFGGAHCMIKGGYSTVVESLADGLCIYLNHAVTEISYYTMDCCTNSDQCNKVKVTTSNGREFSGDAVLITVPLGCLKAESIKFSPILPEWKYSSIKQLGFGVLNKVVLEFSEVFWDDTVDYFGATAEETNHRGHCFMFWNVRKTVGAPVLIALVVGQAAIDGQNLSSTDHVNHAVMVLRKLFGEASVPEPVASVVTDWGRDPYSYGAYSYVAVGASGEDYDILGKPVENCVFFAGEATCKEHPDTVGGAMMSGLREAVRIIDILTAGSDYTAEVEAMEAAQRCSDGDEIGDIIRRLDAVEFSYVNREHLLRDMFTSAKTTAGRLHLAKELLKLPVEVLKSFAGNKEGLSTLNSWILDSMGKDGTQLLRHCVRLLVLVSTNLLAVRLSGIGKTVKEKVCVHTSRDIRAIASQLVSVWIEIFRKEKASNGGLKLLRQSTASDNAKNRSNVVSGKPPLRSHHVTQDNKGNSKLSASSGTHLDCNANIEGVNCNSDKLDMCNNLRLEVKQSRPQWSVRREEAVGDGGQDYALSEEERAAIAAAEAARAAVLVAAKAYESSSTKNNTSMPLPKIPSFHKFARREQYAQMESSDSRRKWSGGTLGRQDCISEIDSRNCRVRDWSLDFSAAGVNLDSSKMSVDGSQHSHSNEIACQLNFREHSGESVAVDSSIFTKAWVDSAGSVGIKDYSAIERWQSQAAAAGSDFFHPSMHVADEEDSSMSLKPPSQKLDALANESSVSQVTVNKEWVRNVPSGAERIKQAVVDYVASLLMPLYKARKIDKEGYKSIMKKTATKVMEQTTDAEKAMAVFEFLDFKRKNKIRAFVDKLIERHMAMKSSEKS